MFFKKKKEFPMEEKEEVLKDVPEPVPAPFRSPEELLPPKLPEIPKPPQPMEFGEVKVPQPKPEVPELPKIEPKPIAPKIIEKPHVFIKVEKYKEVMKKLGELADNIQRISDELNTLEAMEAQEKARIDEAENTIKRMNEIIKFLDETFRNAEM